MIASDDQGGSDGLDGPPEVHRCGKNKFSSLQCQKSDSISERQIVRLKGRQRRGRLKMVFASAFVFLAFVTFGVEGRPQTTEGKNFLHQNTF